MSEESDLPPQQTLSRWRRQDLLFMHQLSIGMEAIFESGIAGQQALWFFLFQQSGQFLWRTSGKFTGQKTRTPSCQ